MSKTPTRSNGNFEIIYPEAKAQAFNDLKVLLTHRINELIIGGFLIILIGSRNGEERLNTHELFIASIKQLFETNKITKQEYQDCYWHSYYFNIAELTEILEHFADKIAVKQLDLHCDACPFYQEYLQTGDINTYTEKVVAFSSALIRSALFSCLKKRNQNEKEKIFQLLRNNISRIIEDSPIEYKLYNASVVIKKISNLE